MSEISRVLKQLCAAPQQIAGSGNRDGLDPVALHQSFAAMLDGGASEMEAGAMIAAASMLEGARDFERFAPLLLSLLEVVQDRLSPLPVTSSATVVVIPNYADAFRHPHLSALALLLQRTGVKVLMHGALETVGGLFTTGLLREFGVLPAPTRGMASRDLAEKGIALVPTALLAPGLAAMLAMRNQLGISTPATRAANMLTAIADAPGCVAHVLAAPAWLQQAVTAESCFLRAPALLAVQSNQEVSAMAAPMILQADLQRGAWATLYEGNDRARQANSSCGAGNYAADVPPAWDTKAWADWTRRLLGGKAPLPVALLQMLAACLVGCGYARDINEAKAIAAVGGAGSSGLAAA